METRPAIANALETDWPLADLEAVASCVICGGSGRSLWQGGLTDRIFHAAPGRWNLWRCADCGSVQLDPRPSPGSIGRAYSAYYTHQGPEKHFLVPGDRPRASFKRGLHLSFYNRRFGHAVPGAWPLGWVAIAASRRRSIRAGQAIRHLPGAATGARLLDVGCGDGSFLRIARALGFDAQGIEFDPAAGALAQAQGFIVHVSAIDAVAVEPASIDQITLNHVIEHLHAPVAALQRMRQWLRPGARIWLQTPNIDGAGARHYGADWRGLEPPRHLVMFTPHSLRAALERAGFERVSVLPPLLDARFYIAQSEAIRAGHDPYLKNRAARRVVRRQGRAWDRLALREPDRADSITMTAYRPR